MIHGIQWLARIQIQRNSGFINSVAHEKFIQAWDLWWLERLQCSDFVSDAHAKVLMPIYCLTKKAIKQELVAQESICS